MRTILLSVALFACTPSTKTPSANATPAVPSVEAAEASADYRQCFAEIMALGATAEAKALLSRSHHLGCADGVGEAIDHRAVEDGEFMFFGCLESNRESKKLRPDRVALDCASLKSSHSYGDPLREEVAVDLAIFLFDDELDRKGSSRWSTTDHRSPP